MNSESFYNPSSKDSSYCRSLNSFVVSCAKKGMAEGKPKTAEELAERIDWYFSQCQIAGFIPTFEGLAVSINYTPMYLKTLASCSNRPRLL